MSLTIDQFRADLGASLPLRRRFRRLWKRQNSPVGRCGAKWWLNNSDAHVQHCGHPTALYPYYWVDEAGEHHATPSGKGYRNLLEAQMACFLDTLERRAA